MLVKLQLQKYVDRLLTFKTTDEPFYEIHGY
jgi:hypothetical protein